MPNDFGPYDDDDDDDDYYYYKYGYDAAIVAQSLQGFNRFI